MGTAVLKPYKQEVKAYQNDTENKRKIMRFRTCWEHENEFEYNDPPETDPTLLYYYYREDKRGKVYWYGNMYGRERLLEALNELKA